MRHKSCMILKFRGRIHPSLLELLKAVYVPISRFSATCSNATQDILSSSGSRNGQERALELPNVKIKAKICASRAWNTPS